MPKYLPDYRPQSKELTAKNAKNAKLVVTKPCYDDIGQVLRMLDRPYTDYTPSTGFDCDMFFLNCGTNDPINQQSLRKFVAQGGILYASDLTSSLVESAFPGVFTFSPISGEQGTMVARVRDEELLGIMGKSVTIHFDLGMWSVLNSINRGKIILESQENGKPLMVQVPFEKGMIFYTCFHNHAQANAKEKSLLELLNVKIFAEFEKTSVKVTLEKMQTGTFKKSLDDYRDLFTKN